MKLERLPLLDQLAISDERCVGAAFTTFTFEPSFFENHVLASVLRVSNDPDEAAAAYHEEALAILQETPVVCFVDASMRVPGHQLPYDLREIRDRCFHPKVSLVLFDSFARLAVGSANLTKQGYGRNAETVFMRNLRYAEPADAALIRSVVSFFESLDAIATQGGTQTRALIEAVSRRIDSTPIAENESLHFLHTEQNEPLLPRLLALLPANATITRIGLLAPFFERDDVDASPTESMSSVLLELAKRAGKKAVFDLGVGWDEAPIAPSAGSAVSFADHLNSLWAYTNQDEDDETTRTVNYAVPIGVTAAKYRLLNESGESRMYARDAIDPLIEEGRIWHVGTPRVFAPATLVDLVREHVSEVRVWLHPTSQLAEGRPIERPLHAKLLAISYRTGSKLRTLVVVGSANASRMALLSTPSEGGNVEACMAFMLDDEVALDELAPELNFCGAPVEWTERTFPDPAPLPSVPDVRSAVYTPQTQTLTVTWAAPPRPVERWTLGYHDIPLASGDSVPEQPTVVHPFRLSPSSCEVYVEAHDGRMTFPIVVDDLTALPLDGFQRPLDLRELLALVGRRLTPSRHKVIAQKHGAAVLDATLTSLLGENFAPTDVLRAWWTVAHDLSTAGLTVAGFRLRLLGTLGANAVWQCLFNLAGQPNSGVRPEEAWFYGAELLRTLAAVRIPDDADLLAKREVLGRFTSDLRAQLSTLRPVATGRPWVAKIVDFYEEPAS